MKTTLFFLALLCGASAAEATVTICEGDQVITVEGAKVALNGVQLRVDGGYSRGTFKLGENAELMSMKIDGDGSYSVTYSGRSSPPGASSRKPKCEVQTRDDAELVAVLELMIQDHEDHTRVIDSNGESDPIFRYKIREYMRLRSEDLRKAKALLAKRKTRPSP